MNRLIELYYEKNEPKRTAIKKPMGFSNGKQEQKTKFKQHHQLTFHEIYGNLIK